MGGFVILRMLVDLGTNVTIRKAFRDDENAHTDDYMNIP